MKTLTNAAAEQLILGSCLRDSAALDTVIERLAPSDFADPRAGIIYAAICRTTLAGKSGSVAVVEELRASGELDTVGGDRAITYLESKGRKNKDTILEAAATLTQLARKRDQAATASKLARTLAEGGDASAEIEALTGGASVSSDGWADLGMVLDAIIAGTHRRLEPTLLTRSDGAGLLYQGRLNWVAAPPESMKSWLAKLTCVQLMEEGRPVVYVDFEESEPTSCTERICSIALGRGHSMETVRKWFSGDSDTERLFYYRAATTGLDAPERAQVLRIVRRRDVPFVVLDGVAAAMGSHTPPLEEDKARDVSLWLSAYAWPLVQAGAGVLCVDHTVKNTGGAAAGSYVARSPRGSGAKLAAVSGTALMAEVKIPGSAWTRGEVQLYVVKDRPGRVRVATRSSKRLAATLVSTPQPAQAVECTRLELFSPDEAADLEAEKRWDLICAEALSKILSTGGTLTRTEARDILNEQRRNKSGKGWKNDTVTSALAFLVANGWATEEKDGRASIIGHGADYRAEYGEIHADDKPAGGKQHDPF